MALAATKCPHCKTTFRVASDQLKLRGGIVRCGTCHQVFDGNASLVEMDVPPAPPPEPAWSPDSSTFAEPVLPRDEQEDEEEDAPLPDMLAEPELEFGAPSRAPSARPDKPPVEVKLEADPDFDAFLDPKPAPEDDFIPSASDAFDALMAEMDEPAPELPRRGEYVLDFDLTEPPARPAPKAAAAWPELPDEEALPEPEPFVEAEFYRAPEEVPEPEPFNEADFETPPEDLPEPEPFVEAEFNPPPEELPEPEAFVEEDFDTPEEALPEPEPFDETEFRAQLAHDAVPEPEPFSDSEFGADIDDDASELSLADEPGASFSSEQPSGNTLAPDLESGPLPLLRASSPDHTHDLLPPLLESAAPYEGEEEEDEEEHDEPEFVRRAREKELAARKRRRLMAAGSALLVVALLVQGMTIFRNVLVARYPALKPAVSALCAPFHCKVELPAQIEAITVETGELQTISPTLFRYSTVLRNDSALVQAWPYLELALKDGSKVVVRRVFTPPQFLPAGTTPASGFAPHSEQAVTINFELKQLKASGFDIAVFYP